jgi:DHA1 family tetracycline resistance protein-like MFS transporter
MGANISTAQAYIADVTTEENRAKGMGMIGAAFGLGFIFGPALGGVLSHFGSHVPFYFAAVLALANAVMLYFVLPETIKKGGNHVVHKTRFALLLEAFQQSRFAVVTILYFLVITAFSIMTTAFSLYTAYRFDYGATQNGYLFAYIGILSVIMQGGLIGFLSRKFGEIWLISAGCLILVISLFLVPFVSPENGGLAGLLAGIAMFAIGNSISTPNLTSLGSKLAPAESQGSTLGVLQSAASLARAVGPALAGVLLYSATAPQHIDDLSLFRTYWTASAIMLAAFLLSLYFIKTKSENRLEQV